MTTKVVPGQLVATADAKDVAKEAAARIARTLRAAIAKSGRATLALSGGNTPRAAYALLAKDTLDWSKIEIYWVDERACEPTDDRSNFRWAKEALIDAAPVPMHAVHRMQGDARDLDAAAESYAALLRARLPMDEGVPRFDALVLGVGDDGHTASLFPGEPHVSITDKHVVAVPAKGDREARLTVTTPVIERAQAVFILAVGGSKSEPLERTWSIHGDVGETPARIVRNVRGSLTWLIDRAAGGIAS